MVDTDKVPEDADFINYGEENQAIKDALEILRDGAFDNTLSYRDSFRDLKRGYNNVFDKNISQDENTLNTEIIKSPLSRIQVDVAKRRANFPSYDIEPLNVSKFDVEGINKTEIAKSLLEFAIRTSGFEQVYQESKEEWFAYGDTFRRPIIRPSKKDSNKSFFGYEDISAVDLMIDPQARNIHSESFHKQAQYFGHTQTYSQKELVSRFGKWILDFAEPGHMIDSQRVPTSRDDDNLELDGSGKNRHQETDTHFYEVVEYQNKSDGSEFILVGGNAFPALWIAEDRDEVTPDKALSKLISEDKVIWEREYPYKNSLGDNLLMIFQNFCYRNNDWPYNRGITERVFDLQIADEIMQNLQFDNIRQLMDYIFYISGGRPEVIRNQIKDFREEKRTNRDAFLHIPAALSGAIPQFGVLKPDGVPIQEASLGQETIENTAKNSVGINPQRQERLKNASATQVEVLEEEQSEAIEAILEDNIFEFRREIMGFLYFIIAHEGGNLDDILISYKKKEKIDVAQEGDPENFKIIENPNATISIKEAANKLKDFEFDIVIDNSSLIKKSRLIENQKISDALATLPIQEGSQDIATALWKQIIDNLGIKVPEEVFDNLKFTAPSGGSSQQQVLPEQSQQLQELDIEAGQKTQDLGRQPQKNVL